MFPSLIVKTSRSPLYPLKTSLLVAPLQPDHSPPRPLIEVNVASNVFGALFPLRLKKRYAAVRVGKQSEIGRELKQSCQANGLATPDMAFASIRRKFRKVSKTRLQELEKNMFDLYHFLCTKLERPISWDVQLVNP